MPNKINVDYKLVNHLSKLDKLKFDKKSSAKIKLELSKIINFIDIISNVDTDNITPLIYMSDEINVLRDDEIKNKVSQQDALKNAPQKDSDYFKAPTVFKK